MPVNVGEAICADTGVLVMVDQPNVSQWVDGEWVESEKHSFPVFAVTHSLSQNDLKNLHEGEWSEEMLIFTCNKPIHNISDFDSREPAMIRYEGKTFKVIAKADWTAYGFNSVIGARVE